MDFRAVKFTMDRCFPCDRACEGLAMLPNQENPDFSFLNDSPAGKDSAILAQEKPAAPPESSPAVPPPAPKPAPPAAEKSKEKKPEATKHKYVSNTQPAWMEQPVSETDAPSDSSTRFAAALSGQSSPAPGVFSFEEKTEQIQAHTPEPQAGEETVVDESLSAAVPAPRSAEAESAEDASSREENLEENSPEAAGAALQSSLQVVAPEQAGVTKSADSPPTAEEAVESDFEPSADEATAETLDEIPVTGLQAGELSDAVDSDEATALAETSSEQAAAEVAEPATTETTAAETSPAESEDEAPAAAEETTAELSAFNLSTSFLEKTETPPASPAEPAASLFSAAETAAPAATAATVPAATAVVASSRSKKKGKEATAETKGNLPTVLLVSYASAVTLFCLYLLMQSMMGKPHDLESLPDLKPPMKNDEIAYKLISEKAGMPAGHTLRIGESRRFGNLEVTALRVEKEPLNFSHYTGDPSRKREATQPVLKLWLKFENVSKDQKFAPLDRQLLLTRIVDPSQPEFVRSNQFVCPASKKGQLDQTSLLYDLEMHGDWNFAGISDNPVIGPGESVELYLPSSDEKTPAADAPLLWRVQFRKGYHPKSYRGVTTVIEVKVDPAEIKTA